MKQLSVLILILFLVGCVPSPVTLVPVETLVAQTMAAMPKTDTPLPPTFTLVPTATVDLNTPTPDINLAAPGAYCLPQNTQRVKALVTRVLDGDSVEVASGNTTFRVRYIGMDAPAISPSVEWRAPQAMAMNERLVNGKVVTLIKDVSETDPAGYYLRYVMADNTFVNYELVRQGYGKVVITPPDVACENALLAAQAEAQAIVAGLWEPTPLPTYTITPTPTITLTPTETKAVRPVCDCEGPILTCNNFRNWNQAQACFDYCIDQGFGDIFNLDKNGNGMACDGLRP